MAFRVDANPRSGRDTSLAAMASRCLARSLARALRARWSVSAAKPQKRCPGRLRGAMVRRMSGVGSHAICGGPSLFLSLWGLDLLLRSFFCGEKHCKTDINKQSPN